ncbi:MULTISPECIES: translation initiation factor IF-2 [Peptoniphilus]|uniref:Translation initiation factor IF-2 n=1 Tax=Peptoniphilus harei TaxID=54005 RepID=A0A943SP74_9FIRM|nr:MULTISPECIES: translation initiation factor IF-2 [Peptoniphilus]MBS6534387.1 translation initiation factor IF-2 [Peptoniphilus harei]MDU2373699.1 translation initiation factor IF-2 [Peptoniphilus harei]MDU3086471.1 translation initiation factor IF-2 [Peptoniphilus harei]MDU5470491.1 translation initiation factor IF-2 [Peptoniphilus harei]MDU6743098.1 translation initiation factor IF-2 [Peptoniphilus harei]
MSKIRVHALAKEIGITSKELIAKLNELEISVKNHMSTLDSAEEDRVRNLYNKNSSKNDSPVEKKNNDKQGDNKKKTHPNKEKQNNNNSDNKEFKKDNKNKTFNKENKKNDDKSEHSSNQKKKNNKKNKSKNKENDNDKNHSFKRDLTKKKPKKKVRSKHKVEEEDKGDDSIIVIAPITVKDFANQLGVSVSTVITKLIGLGVMANQNQSIDEDTCILLADELGIEIEIEAPNLDQSVEEEYGLLREDRERDLKPRPPVVTVMGHVDHGKTSLLDSIKKTHVTQSEAGGITQHIGAYTVNLSGKKITFLDTPGHEAFTSMRLRGAQTTDIAILVVAADDGVMPQTIEAISHARSADVPIIVAITKIDKPEGNPERVKQELMNENLVPEEWGGDTIVVGVSSKSGEGIDELLEMILLVAEMKELKANPNRRAIGTIIEANLDKAKGPMATILIKNGTLRFGDAIVSGTCSGRIRAMEDDKGKKVKKAGPSMPVVILGLNDVPNAGDTIYAVNDDKTAKAIADKNTEISREKRLSQTTKISLDNLFEKISEEDVKELNVVVKGDVKGSVEALNQSLLKLSTEEVKISVIHSGVGGINESDVTLASASNAIVIGFNVRPNINAIELAKTEDVEIRTYRVIYEIINDIEQAAKGMLDPDIVEEILGRCEIRQTFKLPNNQMVAGVYVLNGKILRNSKVKVLRDDVVIHEGDIASLKRFKDDARELATGFEGGLVIDGFNDIKEGDLLESYIMKEVERS